VRPAEITNFNSIKTQNNQNRLKSNNNFVNQQNFSNKRPVSNNSIKESVFDKSSPNFKGAVSDVAFNLLDKSFNVLDKNAMIQVSFIDIVSTIVPRTIVDLKTSLAAAFETCRRESSGLVVNCLMPGAMVLGIAHLLPKTNELKSTKAASSWANADSINKLKEVYKKTQDSPVKDKTKAYVERTLSSLEGLDGKNWVRYSDKANEPQFKESVDKIAAAIKSSNSKERKILLKQAHSGLADLTKAENILRFDGKPQANLAETLRDVVDLGSKFDVVRDRTVKSVEEGKPVVSQAIDKYSSSLTKFVNKKSFIGLGIVIGIAVSIQKINRAITRKQFNAEGAPIYKDFGKKDTTQKMDEKQKKKFFGEKLVAAGGMFGLAALSMMKKPSKSMFQFSGIFPTMDQCRWIASSTFASRMLAAEDENELRESTIRDIASFSGLYFLGDYVKKGAASLIEKASTTKTGAKILGENVVLLNRKKEVTKPVFEKGASITEKAGKQIVYRAKQFGNWIKNTDLKTANEVANVKVRNMRNICRVADIAFSIVMLGILLPKYNRAVTNKKVEAAKKQEELNKQSSTNFIQQSQLKTMPNVFKELV